MSEHTQDMRAEADSVVGYARAKELLKKGFPQGKSRIVWIEYGRYAREFIDLVPRDRANYEKPYRMIDAPDVSGLLHEMPGQVVTRQGLGCTLILGKDGPEQYWAMYAPKLTATDTRMAGALAGLWLQAQSCGAFRDLLKRTKRARRKK